MLLLVCELDVPATETAPPPLLSGGGDGDCDAVPTSHLLPDTDGVGVWDGVRLTVCVAEAR